MTVAKIEKAEWHSYFDRVSRELEGKSVEIDVEALSLGSQVEQEWIPLLGLTYEPRDDILSVMVEGLNHLIRSPRTVYVDIELGQVSSMEVVDADDYLDELNERNPFRAPGGRDDGNAGDDCGGVSAAPSGAADR